MFISTLAKGKELMEGKLIEEKENYNHIKFSEWLKPYFPNLEIQSVRREWMKCGHKSCNWILIAYYGCILRNPRKYTLPGKML